MNHTQNRLHVSRAALKAQVASVRSVILPGSCAIRSSLTYVLAWLDHTESFDM